MHSRRSGVFVIAVVLISGTASAQRDLKEIPLPDPELERKSFIVADGFEVNLFAADPQIAKPIQMNFDPEGRLWMVSSEIYPHIKPGQKPTDRVLVLQDTDGDGASDKTTVFADGLLIPTGIEPGDGGAYVAASTELLHFKDTDGDLKADEKRIVLSGFGTEDTHHIIHTLRWGPAGHLYFNQSIYIHSHIETPYGVERLNGGGIWRFNPQTLRLGVFMRGMYNAWGHAFDAYGQSFATDGAGGEGISYVFPGVSFPAAVGVPRVMHGLNPGSPKHCGLEITSGRHLPEQWRGNLLTNDFRGHRVCRFVVTEDGAGFASREMTELIKTDHVAFRPVDIKMGPDGAIYIADWYSPIIQHGEVDFRDPRRDHTHGRIWRVTYKGRPLVEPPRLVGAAVSQLLEHLKSPEGWTRKQAKRVLKERGREEALPALEGWVSQLDETDPSVERHRLEALWLYESLREVKPELLEQSLRSPEQRVRAAATRVVGQWRNELEDPLELLSRQADDEHPRVRLEAVRALGRFRDPRAVEIALSVLDREMDRFLDYGLWLTCRELGDLWLPLVRSGKLDFGGDVEKLTFALKAVGGSEAVEPLVQLLQEEKVAGEDELEVASVIAEMGGPRELGFLVSSALDSKQSRKRQAALLTLLAETTRRRNIRPQGELSGLIELVNAEDAEVTAAAIRCAGLWKIEAARKRLTGLAASDESPGRLRQAAIDALAALGGPKSRRSLEKLITDTPSAPVRMQSVAALAAVDLKRAAEHAVRVLQRAGGDEPLGIVFAAFLARKGGAGALAEALKDQKLPADVARVGLSRISASGREHPNLSAALRSAGGITTGPRELSPEELQQMVARVREEGDAHRGEQIFRRQDLACLKCHAIAGAGGRVGPDLVSIGASAQVDYLIESLLVPNKAIKENYHTLVVVTTGGRVHTGIKVRETARELVLRDAEDREITVPRGQIAQRSDGKSLMPAGVTEKLTEQQLIDLVRFLSELGKVGELQVRAGDGVVRRWEILQSTEESRRRIRRTRHATAATDDEAFTWQPAYSTVAGELPIKGLPEVARNRLNPGAAGTAFVRCELDVMTAGKCRMLLNSSEGLSMWVGTRPIPVGREIELELPERRHRLTFAVDLSRRRQGLKLQVSGAEGSSARAGPTAEPPLPQVK